MRSPLTARTAIEETETTARGVLEGNVFINVTQIVSDYSGQLFCSGADSLSECATAFGRDCVANEFTEADIALDTYLTRISLLTFRA